MDQARYRGLRGIVRNVLPRVRKRYRIPSHVRDGVGWLGNMKRVYRHCCWCGFPTTEPRRRYWHSTCVDYYLAARGTLAPPGNQFFVACAECGDKPSSTVHPTHEIDHRVALSVAAARGPKDHAMAFLPENLQWLCRYCHRRKTTRDRRILANIRAGRPEDYVVPPPEPKVPYQDPAQMELWE